MSVPSCKHIIGRPSSGSPTLANSYPAIYPLLRSILRSIFESFVCHMISITWYGCHSPVSPLEHAVATGGPASKNVEYHPGAGGFCSSRQSTRGLPSVWRRESLLLPSAAALYPLYRPGAPLSQSDRWKSPPEPFIILHAEVNVASYAYDCDITEATFFHVFDQPAPRKKKSSILYIIVN
ncbi:LADA_0A01530g1_1 [Lachancea dasiensis]|uniref:LADA_0A01530g1_1 n=1 Tax=Lachancea dasiensis TaxID=1072105 RepID=A0A1G4IM16_9SACH|nr:LADA_0A01530g1_1 [Lachancea dasiensis]